MTKKVQEFLSRIATDTDNLRDSIDEFSFYIGCKMLKGEKVEIDGEEVDIETIERFRQYLEEIRKFALLV